MSAPDPSNRDSLPTRFLLWLEAPPRHRRDRILRWLLTLSVALALISLGARAGWVVFRAWGAIAAGALVALFVLLGLFAGGNTLEKGCLLAVFSVLLLVL